MDRTREEWADWLQKIAPDLSFYSWKHFTLKADIILKAIDDAKKGEREATEKRDARMFRVVLKAILNQVNPAVIHIENQIKTLSEDTP